MSCDNVYFVNEPTFGTGGAATITLSNVGGGTELVNALSSGNYPIKTLIAGTGMSFTVGADTITFNSKTLDGTATDNTLRWDGTNWIENANLKAYSNGHVRITGVTTGNSFGITQLSGADPFIITAGSTTRYLSLIDNTSGQSEYQINKGGSTYQKGNAVIDNNSGLQLAELDVNGSGSIIIKSASNMASVSYTVYMPSTQGSAGTYLKNDGSGNLTWGSVAGGLTYWTESEYTYSGKTGTKLIPNSVNTNQDVVIQPKGEGAFLLREPTGLGTTGNNRGRYSVDLQMLRNVATQVASGDFAFLANGYNQASSNYTAAFGIFNVASGPYAFVTGGNNTASGESSFAANERQITSGTYSTAFGYYNRARSYSEFVIGHFCTDYTAIGVASIQPTDRLFVIGNGTSTGARANAYVMYKNGNAEMTGTLKIGAYTLPNTDGTANQVLKTNGSGVLTWYTPATGGLTYWTESEYTYSGATGTKLIPNSVNTNQSVVLQPKGTGGIFAQQPDGTTTGGNNRGQNAVDLQMSRTSSVDVASGDYSVVLGGADNHATANYGVVGGGYRNEVKALASTIAGGYDNIVQGAYATISGGSGNDTDASYSFIGGGIQNTMHSGATSSVIGGGQQNDILVSSTHGFIGGGFDNTITDSSLYCFIGSGYQNQVRGGGEYSAIVGGIYNDINSTNASNFIGGGRENVMSSDTFRSFIGAGYQNVITGANYSTISGGDRNEIQADAHYGTVIGNNTHIEASAERVIAMGTGARGRRYGEIAWTVNDITGSATGGDNGLSKVQLKARTTTNTPTEIFLGGVTNKRLLLPNNSCSLIKVSWVRRNFTDSSVKANFDEYIYCLRGASAGTTTVSASTAGTAIGNDATGGSLTISADTTNGAVKFEVTGVTGKTLDWLVYAEILEIIH